MKKRCRVFFCVSSLILAKAALAQAENGDFFDSKFLFRPAGQSLPADLSGFRNSNRILPGDQQVQVVVNQRSFGEHIIRFVDSEQADKDAVPCLTPELLRTVGVKTAFFGKAEELAPDQCLDLSLIPEANYAFSASTATLTLSVPQAALDATVRGAIPVEMWNQGESAFYTSYQLSHFRSSMESLGVKRNQHTTFLGVRGGFNLGAWRFRSNGSLYDAGGQRHWNFNENYFERDIPAWRGRIRLGDNTTSSSTFTSSRIRGVKLESDDSMLATSEQGYAPTIEGFANTSAKVTIYQNSNVIYSTFVAPGPFIINDLYAVPGGGDLEVEIEETGGQVTRYLQPYAVLPAMLREGRWQYSAAFGKYRGNRYDDAKEPMVGQVNLAHGLPGGVTAYGGLMGAKDYFAGSLGLAFNLQQFGGLSADIIQSTAKDTRNLRHRGHALRIQYAKNLLETGTNFRFFGYKYSSDGYRSLDQTLSKSQNTNLSWNRSHEYQFSISQSLDKYGSVSANYSKVQFRNQGRSSDTMGLSYSNNIKGVGVFLSYNMIQSQWQEKRRNIMLSFSIPLGVRSTYAGYSFSRQNNGDYAHSANLSGSTLENNALSYNLRAGVSKENGDRGNNFYAGGSYRNSIGQLGLSTARNHKNTQSQIDFSGSVVIDKQGLLLGQYLYDTAIIVDVPSAPDVQLQSHPSIRTNQSGRALIPYASPYRENSVSLAPGYLNDSVTLTQNIQSVVPTRGAIVRVLFETELGRSLIISLKHNDVFVPFGAEVYGADDQQKGLVGPVGRIWLTGLEGNQAYTVKWAEGSTSVSCKFSLDADNLPVSLGMIDKEAVCE
ncbi:fimbria/pilus outer membrane usher protein [Alcaligenes endophyticus]|uniref:Fimbrial biogenesis outer membrane usher protein n=1 Tax=Alcaligenes endophyticus TaxID=1929088 RepID=A0ABT8EFJ4_9BURK|nr:fimbria/pilus outer membrane usher protein [Alcaligenes endophyticus]MCX5590292.1 fimbrial biogenesis outer membrane usher protein [Alcaligenes endophyticus]MDN4120044.1 fimbrial biogenesis outer membrane usher protein [Alcaligenes endophyticus]